MPRPSVGGQADGGELEDRAATGHAARLRAGVRLEDLLGDGLDPAAGERRVGQRLGRGLGGGAEGHLSGEAARGGAEVRQRGGEEAEHG
eukprot:CAMPEP_0206226832 /NCGR_PEP_ID=MMETSP0047_2-20121206/8302_1 /ASSEMBLY_ACC=CAM_ASM_000192 /TAXON_ID=195065 /ORGANISM="Chroomonas mesostigmatica_cf, Strain CCMP1168" /LENGTH=88 /DNA_ID=CAMNT_0053649947 /DNA_START=585 /DNA_END=851 /DNA_ORIENTATION=-